MQEAPSDLQETLSYCEGDQALEQIVQGGCEVSILGHTQRLSGCGLGQLAVGGLA